MGLGSGGAVSIEATHTSTLVMTLIQSNTASDGGALSATDQSSLKLSRCDVLENVGEYFAGAIATSSGVSLSIVDSTVENNVASRLSSIVSFDYENSALYNFINSRFIDYISDGSSVVLLGRVNFTNNIFSTTMPGTVYNIDSASNFFSITFSSCK